VPVMTAVEAFAVDPRTLRAEAAGIRARTLTTRTSGRAQRVAFARVTELLGRAEAVEKAREELRWKG
jgi:hypothetical protein